MVRLQRAIAILGLMNVFAVGAGCAIDFDAPFEQSPGAGASSSVGGTAGSAGDAGTGGGTAGAAGATGGMAGSTGGAGGAAGTAGGTGGTAGSAGGAAGTGGTGIESNCSNGIDDDGDGDVDCADADCSGLGYTCVRPPDGWDGPFVLRTSSENPSSCAAPWGSLFLQGGMNANAPSGGSCPSCTCEPAVGAVCGIDVVVYDEPDCKGNTQPDTFMATGTCINVGMQSFGPQSVEATSGFYVASGSCTPTTTGTETFPPASWTTNAIACETFTVGGGCSPDRICLPPWTEGDLCVAKVGDHTCPQTYPTRVVVEQAIVDTRSCTPCACGSPTGSCAGSEVSVEDPTGGCPGVGDVVSSSTCVDVPVHATYGTFSLESSVPPSIDATCEPTGGAATGGVTGGDLVTFCCSG